MPVALQISHQYYLSSKTTMRTVMVRGKAFVAIHVLSIISFPDNDAATKVRAYYRERGYFLVQAYLPQQEIKGGVI